MEKGGFEKRLRTAMSEYLSTTNTRTMTPVVSKRLILVSMFSIEQLVWTLLWLNLYFKHIFYFCFRENKFYRFSFSYMVKKIAVNPESFHIQRTEKLLVCIESIVLCFNMFLSYCEFIDRLYIWNVFKWFIDQISDQQKKYILFSYLFLEALRKNTITETDLTTLQRMWDKHLLSLVDRGMFFPSISSLELNVHL